MGSDSEAEAGTRKRSRANSTEETRAVANALAGKGFTGSDGGAAERVALQVQPRGLVLASREACPEAELWKSNGSGPVVSKWQGLHVARSWQHWLQSGEWTLVQVADLDKRACAAGAGGAVAVRPSVGTAVAESAPAVSPCDTVKKHTAIPQRLVVYDRAWSASRRLESKRQADTMDVLQQLSNLLSKMHLAFEVPLAQPRGSPRWRDDI